MEHDGQQHDYLLFFRTNVSKSLQDSELKWALNALGVVLGSEYVCDSNGSHVKIGKELKNLRIVSSLNDAQARIFVERCCLVREVHKVLFVDDADIKVDADHVKLGGPTKSCVSSNDQLRHILDTDTLQEAKNVIESVQVYKLNEYANGRTAPSSFLSTRSLNQKLITVLHANSSPDTQQVIFIHRRTMMVTRPLYASPTRTLPKLNALSLGPTSLPPLYSLLQVSIASVSKSDLLVDPCCGSTAALKVYAKNAGFAIGCDISDEWFAGNTSTASTNDGNNYDLVLMDLKRPAWRMSRTSRANSSGLFDILATDLPYSHIHQDAGHQDVDIVRGTAELGSTILNKTSGRCCFWFRDSECDNYRVMDVFAKKGMKVRVSASDEKNPLKRRIWLFSVNEGWTPSFVPDTNEMTSFQPYNRNQDVAGPGTIFEAARQGDIMRFQQFPTSEFSKRDKMGKCVLEYAAGYGQEEVVRYLLQPMLSEGALLYGVPRALVCAMKFGKVGIFHQLIQTRDCFTVKHLHEGIKAASAFGHARIVQEGIQLLNEMCAGVDEEHKLDDCLCDPCRFGHVEVVRVLLKEQLSIAALGQGLIQACQWGHEEVVRLFVSLPNKEKFILFTSDTNDAQSKTVKGDTCLHVAARFSRAGVLELLMDEMKRLGVWNQALERKNDKGQTFGECAGTATCKLQASLEPS